jgi:molybdopterin converting factor small subunit
LIELKRRRIVSLVNKKEKEMMSIPFRAWRMFWLSQYAVTKEIMDAMEERVENPTFREAIGEVRSNLVQQKNEVEKMSQFKDILAHLEKQWKEAGIR